MNAMQEVPVISPDAGDTTALANPNSPASIMKRAKEQQAQSAADMKYDATAPPPEGFQGVVVEWEDPNRYHEIIHGLLLAASVALFLYAAAPGSP